MELKTDTMMGEGTSQPITESYFKWIEWYCDSDTCCRPKDSPKIHNEEQSVV